MKEVFVEIPNLPKNNVSLVVCDGRIDREIEYNLNKLGIRIIKTSKNPFLYDAISYHPDIVFHHLGNNRIIVSPNVDNKFIYSLEDEGFEIIPGKKYIGSQYPDNVSYNVARLKDCAILNIKYTDEVLLDELYKQNIKLIDVKQGYAKCSVCVVDENAIITSDAGIYKKVNTYIDVLLIRSGYINLFNMNYGFIGGSTGLISKDLLAFYGDIEKHPDFVLIYDFLKNFQKSYVKLSKDKVTDYGTLIPLKEYSIL